MQDSHPPDWVLQKAPQLEQVHEDDESTRRQAMKEQLMKYVFMEMSQNRNAPSFEFLI